ncbi:MAG: CbiX/SirB N-terminal domain-containing protein [Terrimicrobiaceae bacterium]
MTRADLRSSALVIVGHGSTVNPDSSTPTLELAREIRRRGEFAEVACCFWKEQPSMRDVLRNTESPTVYVVPNFISEGYFTQTIIPRELGLTGKITPRDGRTIHYCEPVGNHPLMTDALLRRAREVAPGVPPSDTCLLIVGHGTGLNDNSAKAAKVQVAKIRAMGLYAQVEAAYMEEPPLIAEWDQISKHPNVVTVPFFISDGLHSYQDIPVLLGIRDEIGHSASQSAVFFENPHHLRGKTLYYSKAIGTEPGMADVIIDQAGTAANFPKVIPPPPKP